MTPATLWSSWNLDPPILLSLLLVGWLYATGVSRLWRRAGVGHGIQRRQVLCFAAGLLAIVVALESPLDVLSLSLVSAHMVQHLALIVVVAPLLVLGRAPTALLWAMPHTQRRALGRWWLCSRNVRRCRLLLTAPLVVLVLHTGVLWVWHLPAFYQAAVNDESIHAVEHATFLITALLLWWTVVNPGRAGLGMSVLVLFVTGMQSSVLGVLFTFARSPWYPVYADRTGAWGLTPLSDQQLAGVIMWVPAGTLYTVAAAVLFIAWLRGMERAMRAREQGGSAVLAWEPRAATETP